MPGPSFTLAVVNGIKPLDELDAMQVAQMVAIHMATIRLSGELARAEAAAGGKRYARDKPASANLYGPVRGPQTICSGGEQTVRSKMFRLLREGRPSLAT